MRLSKQDTPGSVPSGRGMVFAEGTATEIRKEFFMRSILLWLLGVPIPIIILLALFWH
jgi:hypothetical protein